MVRDSKLSTMLFFLNLLEITFPFLKIDRANGLLRNVMVIILKVKENGR